MLHCGASGFGKFSEANRKAPESYFVAIVTPGDKALEERSCAY